MEVKEHHRIEEITDKEDFIRAYPWLQDIEFTDMTPADCLGRCLNGNYSGCLGYKNDTPVGVVIYYIFNKTNCYVVGLWAKNNLDGFQDLFFQKMKSLGIKKIRSSTTRNDQAYGRLMGMNRLWSVYERVL